MCSPLSETLFLNGPRPARIMRVIDAGADERDDEGEEQEEQRQAVVVDDLLAGTTTARVDGRPTAAHARLLCHPSPRTAEARIVLGTVERGPMAPSSVLVLCTGNATRSVIAGAVLRAHLPDVDVVTAGTLSIDGLPMSWRTRAGFESVDVPVPAHRSRQVVAADLDRATLVIALAPEHVEWVRREHPAAADKTATLKRLVRELARRRSAAGRARRRPGAGRGRARSLGGGRRPRRR